MYIVDGLACSNKQWGIGSITQNSNESSVYIPITITSKLVIVTLDRVNRNNPVIVGFYTDGSESDKKNIKIYIRKY